MRSDYEILGIDRSADPATIKKAYFKLVRQYSPEKEPELFQEIRSAYERLSQENEEKYNVRELGLKMPEEPFAQVMLKQIEALIGHKDFEGASATAAEAIRYFGEYEALLFELAYSQQRAGHSGRAAKNYEKLLVQFPQKALYLRGLALAYYDRGYTKKALAAFGQAYAAGMRDADFILEYSLCCSKQEDYARGIALLLELLGNCSTGEDAPLFDYLEAYTSLFDMDYESGGENYPRISEQYQDFLDTFGSALLPHRETIEEITDFYVHSLRDPDDLPLVKNVLGAVGNIFPSAQYPQMWKLLDNDLLDARLQIDTRLSDEVSGWYEAFIEAESSDAYDDSIVRFMQAEAKLTVLERLPKIQSQMKIIEKEYPEIYHSLHEFIKSLPKGNTASVKEKLLRQYDLLAKHIGGGHHYDLHES